MTPNDFERDWIWSGRWVASWQFPGPNLRGKNEGLRPPHYWRSIPRVRLDRKCTKVLLPDASMGNCTLAMMSHEVVQCLN